MVISAFKTRETGHPFLALSTAVRKAASSAPGIFAVTSKWLLVMVKPASVFSRVIVAFASMLSAVSPALASCPLNAMAKQPECAAAISSSGLVPIPLSKRVLKEYCVSLSTPLWVDILPFPSLSPPLHTAVAVRCIGGVSSVFGLTDVGPTDKHSAGGGFAGYSGLKQRKTARGINRSPHNSDSIRTCGTAACSETPPGGRRRLGNSARQARFRRVFRAPVRTLQN